MLLRPRGAPSRPARARHPATRPAVPETAPETVPETAQEPMPETMPVRDGVRLSVDVGSVRVGIARSDPGGILASPLTVVPGGPSAGAEVVRLGGENEAIEVAV